MELDNHICINIEDLYGAFNRLMSANKPIVYTNWGYYEWLLIQSLPDDDNTLVFKVRMLNQIEKPSHRYYMLRCEIELMEERRLVSKMRQSSVLSIRTNIWSGGDKLVALVEGKSYGMRKSSRGNNYFYLQIDLSIS